MSASPSNGAIAFCAQRASSTPSAPAGCIAHGRGAQMLTPIAQGLMPACAVVRPPTRKDTPQWLTLQGAATRQPAALSTANIKRPVCSHGARVLNHHHAREARHSFASQLNFPAETTLDPGAAKLALQIHRRLVHTRLGCIP
eukprot:1241241-Prymnesium_polylepis.1